MLPDLTLGQIKKCRTNFAISLLFKHFYQRFYEIHFITDKKSFLQKRKHLYFSFQSCRARIFFWFRAQCPALFVLILRALSFKQNKVIILYVLPTLLLKVPGLESQSISVLKHCIPIVNRRHSTVSVYPKSMLQPHHVQSIRIDTFFLKIACTSLVLILMMFIVNSLKNLKIWAMLFLSMTTTYNLKTLQETY